MIVANSKEKSKKYSKKIENIFICLQNERLVESKTDSRQVAEAPDIVGTHIGNIQAASSLRAMGCDGCKDLHNHHNCCIFTRDGICFTLKNNSLKYDNHSCCTYSYGSNVHNRQD